MILISQLLARCLVTTPACAIKGMCWLCIIAGTPDYYAGLYLSELLLAFLKDSKRYVPEAINFLSGLFSLATSAPSSAWVLPHFAGLHVKQQFILDLGAVPDKLYERAGKV